MLAVGKKKEGATGEEVVEMRSKRKEQQMRGRRDGQAAAGGGTRAKRQDILAKVRKVLCLPRSNRCGGLFWFVSDES